MVTPKPYPIGWLTPRGFAILCIFVLSMVLITIASMLTKVSNEKGQQQKTSLPYEFKTIQGETLRPGILFDAGIDNRIIELGKGQEFRPSPGKHYLYILTSKPLTEKSKEEIKRSIGKTRSITRIEVGDYGVAIEKIQIPGEDSREEKKMLHPWRPIFNNALRLLKLAEFEPE